MKKITLALTLGAITGCSADSEPTTKLAEHKLALVTPAGTNTTWEGPKCNGSTFDGCKTTGSPVCTDAGGRYYPNWTSSAGALCNQACTPNTPANRNRWCNWVPPRCVGTPPTTFEGCNEANQPVCTNYGEPPGPNGLPDFPNWNASLWNTCYAACNPPGTQNTWCNWVPPTWTGNTSTGYAFTGCSAVGGATCSANGSSAYESWTLAHGWTCAAVCDATPTCPAADPNDSTPDDDALQACLNLGGTIKLQPGSPGYIIAKGLRITQNGTTITSSAVHPNDSTVVGRATLKAAAGLTAPILSNCDYPAPIPPNPQNPPNTPPTAAQCRDDRDLDPPHVPLLYANCPAISNVKISYIEFDGNRPQRDKTFCNPGYRPCAVTVRLDQVTQSAAGGSFIKKSRLQRGLCGTALSAGFSSMEIADNLIDENGAGRERNGQLDGSPNIIGPWADGITMGNCLANVHDNVIIDATDVGIVSGGGTSACKIQRNDILQVSRHAFAGIHMGYFDEGLGVHTGAMIGGTTASLGNQVWGAGLMSFGIAVGAHPWFTTPYTKGGTVRYNTVSGAKVNLMIEGVCGVTVTNNLLSNAYSDPAIPIDPSCNASPTNCTISHRNSGPGAPASCSGGTVSIPVPPGSPPCTTQAYHNCIP